MISEKLLTEVIGRKCEFSLLREDDFLEYKFWINKTEHFNLINIYELAFKCRSHFMLLGFDIKTWFNEIDTFIEIYYLGNLVYKKDYQCIEYKAIFKACEWILQNKR